MPEEKEKNVLVKRKVSFIERINILSKIKNRLPHISKRILILLIITLSIPLTVGLALIQQEIRSRASGGDGGRAPMIIGMNLMGGNVYSGLGPLRDILELMKTQTGEYPGIIPIWRHFDTPTSFPDIETQNYLKEKGIGLAIYLMPQSKYMERYDGRFLLSHQTAADGSFPAGQVRFDNVIPGSITKIFVSKESRGTEETKLLANSWVPGQKIKVLGSKSNEDIDYQNDKHFEFTINSKTDKGAYWELGVTSVKTASLDGVFSDNKPVFITMPDAFDGKKFSNQGIADGEMDEYFKDFARQAKDYGEPVLFRYGHEMNGKWFAWSAKREETLSYGRRRFFGPENSTESYKAAWKRVYRIVNNIAPNVKFYWCSLDKPDMDYYPGDDFVDYVGFDSYSGSGSSPHRSIKDAYESPMRIFLEKTNKPIIIGETGINANHSKGVSGDFADFRRKWIIEGYQYAYDTWPKLKAILYYNIDMRNKGQKSNNWVIRPYEAELEVNNFPDITNAYKRIATDPRFQGKFGGRSNPRPSSVPSNPPSPSPTPGPELPVGYLDASSCVVSSGWACDDDNYNKSLDVEFYADGPAGSGTFLGKTNANLNREEAVGAECGGVRNHGFSFSTPSSLKDGQPHRVYAYAVDDSISTSKGRLLGSPKNLTCTGGPPPSPEPTPRGCIRAIPSVTYGDLSKSGKRKQTLTYKITIKNNDKGCPERKIALDLDIPVSLRRWSYGPEFIKIASGQTKEVSLWVKSGRYASFGTKNLNLSVEGGYKPHTVFDTQVLKYTVTQ